MDSRLLVGVVLVLVSVLVGSLLFARASSTTSVWALARDLQPGATLVATDIRPAQVKLSADAQAYLPTSQAVVGQVLRRAVGRGELLPRAAVANSEPDVDATTVTIPFGESTAPTITRGDRLAVWVSTRSCQAVKVFDDVTVQQVGAPAGGLASSNSFDVVVRVSPELAERVVTALDLPDATLRAGVLSGRPAASANSSLPSLSGCGAAAGGGNTPTATPS